MKRFTQIITVVQVALAAFLGMRIVEVAQVSPPEFHEHPPRAARLEIAEAAKREKPSPRVTSAIVDGNLFETERGFREEVLVEDVDGFGDDIPDEPLPPPTTVTLNGVMLLGPEPVAIITDTAVGAGQQRLRRGDMLGDYEVGAITSQSVMLLGAQEQEFLVALNLKTGGGGGGGPRTPSRPAARTPPTSATRRPTQTAAQARAAAARVQAERERNPAPGESPTMTARERAQAARERAQQAARDRAANQQDAQEEEKRPDPVQARLEALRRLREAAKNR